MGKVEDANLPAERKQELEAMVVENMRTIDEACGDGLEYSTDRIVAEVRFYLLQGGMAMLHAGRRLIQLKEHEPHGNFTKCLEQLDISRQVASNMMKSARKFLDEDGRPTVKLVLQLTSITKIYELAMMDDEDLKTLEEGGSLAGKTLDDIQVMTATEVRNLYRKEREERRAEREAQAEILSKKNQRIDELQEKLHKKNFPYSWEPEANLISAEIDTIWMTGTTFCDRLTMVMGRIREVRDEDWNGAQRHLFDKLARLMQEVGNAVDDAMWNLQAGYIPNKLSMQFEDTKARAAMLREEFAERLPPIEGDSEPIDPIEGPKGA